MAGRVGDDPAAALRDHLLDTTERLTTEVPITSITTRDIARAAGVSDGVLYNYFAGKNELLVAALVRRSLRIFARFQDGMPAAGSATVEANLGAIASLLVEIEGDLTPALAGLIADPVLLHRVLAALHEDPQGPQQFFAPLGAYLAAERGLGRVRPDLDVEAVILLLMGTTTATVMAHQFGGARVVGVPGGRVGSAVEVILRGVLPTEA